MIFYKNTKAMFRSLDGNTVAWVLQGDTLELYLFVLCWVNF